MCCGISWQRLVSFSAAVMFGVLVTGFFYKLTYLDKSPVVPAPVMRDSREGYGQGSGVSGQGYGGSGGLRVVENSSAETTPLRIVSKARPSYTDAARQNQVTGVVRLKVTFLASGQIGSVTPVSGLSYGLTEQAVEAAKQIKFEPQRKNGIPQTVSKTIEYSFSIY